MEETREAIVSAAAELFAERGYAGTTIQNIASRAGVVVQTVYNSVGPKSSVLSAVLDRAAAGPEAPRAVPDFLRERTGAAGDAAGLIEVLADWFVQAHPRMSGTHGVIRQAAAHDHDIAQLERQRAVQRFRNYVRAAEQMEVLPGAVPLSGEEVAATIWSIGHPEVYRFLIEDVGWDLDRYRHWVERSLVLALTRPGRDRGEA